MGVEAFVDAWWDGRAGVDGRKIQGYFESVRMCKCWFCIVTDKR